MRALFQRLAGAALLVALGAGTGLSLAYAAVEARMARVYAPVGEDLAVRADPSQLRRGQHWVEVLGQCTTCHGADLGGRELADDPWIGRLWAPNLTPGRGGIAERSDAELVKAIRFGLHADGRPLLMMPAQYLNRLGNADLAAILAYLRSLSPVDRRAPPRRIGPASALAIATGRVRDLIPAELVARHPPKRGAPPEAPSAAYGGYLVETAGCKVCHRDDLSGGLHPLALPGEPAPPDLTATGPLARWSEADFVHAMRTGLTPEGRQLDPRWMPWPRTARMSDLELLAIWRYLHPPTAAAAG